MNKLDAIILQLNSKVCALLFYFFGTISMLEVFGIVKNVVLFIIAVISGLLAIRHYYLKNKLTKKEIELKDQELFKVLWDNKNRENGKQ